MLRPIAGTNDWSNRDALSGTITPLTGHDEWGQDALKCNYNGRLTVSHCYSLRYIRKLNSL